MKTFQNQNQINQPKTEKYSTSIELAIAKTISTLKAWKSWKLRPPSSLTQGQLNHHQLSDIGLSQIQVGLEYSSRDWGE